MTIFQAIHLPDTGHPPLHGVRGQGDLCHRRGVQRGLGEAVHYLAAPQGGGQPQHQPGLRGQEEREAELEPGFRPPVRQPLQHQPLSRAAAQGLCPALQVRASSKESVLKDFFFSVTVDESTTTLFAANDSLTECTNYYLKILPIHESRKIGEKIVPFQTQFPPLTNLTRQLGGWSEVSQSANQKAILDYWDQ